MPTGTATAPKQTPPGKRPVEEVAASIAQGTILEKIRKTDLESLEEKEQSLKRQLLEIATKKILAEAPDEVILAVETVKKIQRRKIEGQRWVDNSGGRVEKEVEKLTNKIKELEEELVELKSRHTALAQDNGKTFGQEMIDEADLELDDEVPKLEVLLETNKIEIDMTTILDSVV